MRQRYTVILQTQNTIFTLNKQIVKGHNLQRYCMAPFLLLAGPALILLHIWHISVNFLNSLKDFSDTKLHAQPQSLQM